MAADSMVFMVVLRVGHGRCCSRAHPTSDRGCGRTTACHAPVRNRVMPRAPMRDICRGRFVQRMVSGRHFRSQGARPMAQDVTSELAPTGVLRAGINLSNFLLVTGKS